MFDTNRWRRRIALVALTLVAGWGVPSCTAQTVPAEDTSPLAEGVESGVPDAPDAPAAPAAKSSWQPLFPADGPPPGWIVTRWDDVSQSPRPDVQWRVERGVLLGGEPRGTWLISEAEYGDFELEFEFKLGPRGNSGLALRAPLRGDPAFDGLELQMADLRYNRQAADTELTGGVYRALAPRHQVYRPTAWNRYYVKLQGSRLLVKLNGVLVQNVDLQRCVETVPRHDGRDALPLKDRPRRGHLGFQELSRDGDRVQIRGARLRVLD